MVGCLNFTALSPGYCQHCPLQPLFAGKSWGRGGVLRNAVAPQAVTGSCQLPNHTFPASFNAVNRARQYPITVCSSFPPSEINALRTLTAESSWARR